MKNADDATLQDLERLAKKLTFVALDECDPRNWTGNGVPMAEMDARTRGDRAYDKKNAGLTVSLLTKVHALIAIHTPEGKRIAAKHAAEEDEMSELMAAAARETEEAMKRLGVKTIGEQYVGGEERKKH
ncbi:hypothetical protein DOC35_19355 [Salmonella enterica subsp. enterica]|nr:hypothetical protein [Salmonella enterica subsp. enterica]